MSEIFISAKSNGQYARSDAVTANATLRQTPVISVAGIWRLETLSNISDIRKNAHLWIELENASSDPNTAFQSYNWCRAWAEVFCKPGASAQPKIFMIFKGDTLVALLPMMLTKHMGAKVLTLFGEPHSQIANAICRDGVNCHDGLKLCMAQAALLAQADVFALGPIPQGSALLAAMAEDQISPDPAEHLSLVNWPDCQTSKNYQAGLSKNKRRDLEKKKRRIDSFGGLKIERLGPDHPQFKLCIAQALTDKRGWLQRNAILSFGLSREGVDEFLASLCAYETSFEVEVERLMLGDRIFSIAINLVGNGVRHCYLSSWNDEFSELSPGTISHHLSIQNSIDEGATGYSFLGFPTPFKKKWANVETVLWRYQEALTPKGKLWLRVWIRTLRPLAKSIINSLKPALKMIKLIATKSS